LCMSGVCVSDIGTSEGKPLSHETALPNGP
jgi:hypothetical protein